MFSGVSRTVKSRNSRTIPLKTALTVFIHCSEPLLIRSQAAWDKMCNQEPNSSAMPAHHNVRLAKVGMRGSPTRAAASRRVPHIISVFLMLITMTHSTFASLSTPLQFSTQTHSLTSRAANESSPLECLQVAAPVLSPNGACQQTLMVHLFAYSYGQPFIGKSSRGTHNLLVVLRL